VGLKWAPAAAWDSCLSWIIRTQRHREKEEIFENSWIICTQSHRGKEAIFENSWIIRTQRHRVKEEIFENSWIIHGNSCSKNNILPHGIRVIRVIRVHKKHGDSWSNKSWSFVFEKSWWFVWRMVKEKWRVGQNPSPCNNLKHKLLQRKVKEWKMFLNF